MTPQLEEDNYLTIQLLSFDRPTGLTERYYFLEMSTLQATTLLAKDRKIISLKILAYTNDNKYLDEQTANSIKTIGEFNDFFLKNTDYYIHDCEIESENSLIISTHDDGEVYIQFPSDNSNQTFINSIFERHSLNKVLIEILKNKPGHYLVIDREGNVTVDFENFDDYIKNGQNQ
jgi:hypothetical protein